MKEKHQDKLLRLWKERQMAKGYDVSGVHSLKEAEEFFKEQPKKMQQSKAQTPKTQQAKKPAQSKKPNTRQTKKAEEK